MAPIITTSQLRANIEEVVFAVRKKERFPQSPLLVASHGGAVYSAGEGWGIIFSWIYSVLDFLGLTESRYVNLQKALKKTIDAYADLPKFLEGHYAKYHAYFHAQMEGKSFDVDSVSDSRHAIADGISVQHYVFKEILAEGEIKQVFIDGGVSPEVLHSIKKIKMGNVRALIQLESLLSGDVPINALAALSRLNLETRNQDDEVGHSVEAQIEDWIQKINALGSRLSVYLFDCALKEVISIVNHSPSKGSHDEKKASLDVLEAALAQRGCQIFEQDDLRHLAKREALKPGQKIQCNGKEFTIGKQISPIKRENDRKVVFELMRESSQDIDESQVLVVGKNNVDLRIEFIRGIKQWGVLFNQLKELDQEGFCAIVERLHTPLSGYEWKSQKYPLEPDDAWLARIICNHLFLCKKQNLFPKGISPKYLMFNQKDELTSSAIFEKEDGFDFGEAENFCRLLSNSNPWIYLYLTNVSTMHGLPNRLMMDECKPHPAVGFFRTAFTNTIKSQRVCIASELIPDGCSREKLDSVATKLCRDGLAIYFRCLAYIREKASKEDEKTLEEWLTMRLLHYYAYTGTTSFLWPGIEEKIKQDFVEKPSNPFKEAMNVVKYFEEEFDEIMLLETGL